MKTMSARDAKCHFGELMDTMQREPVLLTKNHRPVGIFISMEDAVDTLIPELFMEKEPGYDEWLQAKVGKTLENHNSGKTQLNEHDSVMNRVWQRLSEKNKASTT